MPKLRAWATPLTVATFLTMGVTGLLLFFHLDIGLNKLLHEWVGLLMIFGVGAHLVLNWRPFSTYFKRQSAVVIMASGAAVLMLSFIPMQSGGNPMSSVFQSLQAAPIEQVIALSGKGAEDGLAALQAEGVLVEPGQSIMAATGGGRDATMQVIKVLFAD